MCLEKQDNYWRQKLSVWLKYPFFKTLFQVLSQKDGLSDSADTLSDLNPDQFNQLLQNVNVDQVKLEIAQKTASGISHEFNKHLKEEDISQLEKGKKDKMILTHPLVVGTEQNKNCNIVVFDLKDRKAEEIKESVASLLRKDFANVVKDANYDSETLARNIFFYLFFEFPKRLRENNIGDIGVLWDVLPAYNSIPDHSVWHHLELSSAIYSSMKSTSSEQEIVQNDTSQDSFALVDNVSMVVYSITPVQAFIAKARKLRDYWTGSVILSYLAFEGIRTVIDILGPDHIVYPSVQNQSLVEDYLKRDFEFIREFEQDAENRLGSYLRKLNKESKSIASFPNKFLFLCNKDDVEKVCNKIEKEIQKAWLGVSDIVKRYIVKKYKTGNAEVTDTAVFDEIWDKTVDDYWKHSWGSVKLLQVKDKVSFEKILSEDKWKEELLLMEKAALSSEVLYGATHSLAQGVLASGKLKNYPRHVQKGKKCPLCGEHEVLHNYFKAGETSASEYRLAVESFWKNLGEKVNPNGENVQLGKKEELCAVCTLKRFLPVAIKEHREHLLCETFGSYMYMENFPSTTEMAYYSYLKKISLSKERKNDFIQKLHNNELALEDKDLELKDEQNRIIKLSNSDKYYAFLLMDGDKMGDLINGATLNATWESIKNPNISSEDLGISDLKDDIKKRTMSPALHATISDALNNFARYYVSPIINQSGGRLIYAGGDDVCAILPLENAVNAAKRISETYVREFSVVCGKKSDVLPLDETDAKEVGQSGEVKSLGVMAVNNASYSIENEKILMGLGSSSNGISISGAIIIAHHKQPLKEVIEEAHRVLDGVAKEKSGRNSLAIRLKKRSGGDRDVYFGWNKKNVFIDSFEKSSGKTLFDSFEYIIEKAEEKALSASLLYNIENLKGAIEPVIKAEIGVEEKKKMILELFEYEISHSGLSKKGDPELKEIAASIAGLCVRGIEPLNSSCKDFGKEKVQIGNDWFISEALVIANFLARGE